MLEALKWRLVGPFRAGRVTSVAGDPVMRSVFYFGACAGGVWKTEDGGQSWHNISDGFFDSAAVGALAVAPSDRNVVYAGMGEVCIRNNVYGGDGVYRSVDAGRTWAHLGLADTRHIGRIVIHPGDPDLVYVAALGHAFGPNAERGVFRSKDGGKTWDKVLFVSPETGAVDLAMDGANPRVLYASFWQAHRTPYSLSSGGPESGLYRSTDGGDTWTQMKTGLPDELIGRIGITASGRGGRVYATIEAAKAGGIYRTDDFGDHWTHTTPNPELRQRPWYFNHLTADPTNPDTVYATNFNFWRSTDGGVTFQELPAAHVDHHALWIDPKDPDRMINGHDGGAAVSFDGGSTWSTVMNQPTGQFYHVTTDSRTPYRIYGAQQDNSTLSVPSRTSRPGIGMGEAYAVGGGESGYIAVHPENPNIVYAGANGSIITRHDVGTGSHQFVTPWPEEISGYPAGELPYRFQWTFPIQFSPHDPHTLYACGNVVFRTRNEGHSWDEISPDLTRHDPKTLGASGGPVTKDQTGAETYATVFAFAESPVKGGILWAGSDDGLVHVRASEGADWTNVTPPDLPEWSLISLIEASPHDANTAYVVANRYKLDDPAPYVYRTQDLGRTWRKITAGLAANDATRSLREDPQVPGLLYLATDRGVRVSFDGGTSWQSLQQNLPIAPVHDLTVHGDDLILAGHGRGFWALDDLGPLRRIASSAEPPLFYVPETVSRTRSGKLPNGRMPRGIIESDHELFHWAKRQTPDGERTEWLNAGENPTGGLTILYVLPEDAQAGQLTIRDAGGSVLRFWESPPPESRDLKVGTANGTGSGDKDKAERTLLPLGKGAHRLNWDLRAADPEPLPGTVFRGGEPKGPFVPPGTYRAALTVDGRTFEAAFTVTGDPAVGASVADLEAQYQFLITLRDRLSETHRVITRIRTLKQDLDDVQGRLSRQGVAPEVALPLLDDMARVRGALDEIENRLVQTQAKSPKDLLNFPLRLNVKLASLLNRVGVAESSPTEQDRTLYEVLSSACETEFVRLQDLVREEMVPLSGKIATLDLSPLTVHEVGDPVPGGVSR